MEFLVLGRLEVRDDGRTLELGGPKQRAVLQFKALGSGWRSSSENSLKIRKTLDQAAEVSYNITLYDPAGVRSSLGDC